MIFNNVTDFQIETKGGVSIRYPFPSTTSISNYIFGYIEWQHDLKEWNLMNLSSGWRERRGKGSRGGSAKSGKQLFCLGKVIVVFPCKVISSHNKLSENHPCIDVLCLSSKRPKSPQSRYFDLIIVRVILTVELVLVEVDSGDLTTVEGTAGKLLNGLARIGWGHVLEEDLGKAGSRTGDDDVLEGAKRSALLLGILHNLLVVLIGRDVGLGEHIFELDDAGGRDGGSGGGCNSSGGTGTSLAGQRELATHVLGQNVLPIAMGGLRSHILGRTSDAELCTEIRNVVEIQRIGRLLLGTHLDEGKLARRTAVQDGIARCRGQPNLLHGLAEEFGQHLRRHLGRRVANEQLPLELLLGIDSTRSARAAHGNDVGGQRCSGQFLPRFGRYDRSNVLARAGHLELGAHERDAIQIESGVGNVHRCAFDEGKLLVHTTSDDGRLGRTAQVGPLHRTGEEGDEERVGRSRGRIADKQLAVDLVLGWVGGHHTGNSGSHRSNGCHTNRWDGGGSGTGGCHAWDDRRRHLVGHLSCMYVIFE